MRLDVDAEDVIVEEDFQQIENLHPRLREIALLIANGFTNKAIGAQLHLHEGTVKNYVKALYDVLRIQREEASSKMPRVMLAWWWWNVGKSIPSCGYIEENASEYSASIID